MRENQHFWRVCRRLSLKLLIILLRLCIRRWGWCVWDAREFILADLPGLVEGAHAGVGLGHRFLGHAERCRVLLHLVDGTADEPIKNWQKIRHEISAYDAGLATRPELTAISKIDSFDNARIAELTAALKAAGAAEVIALSAVTGAGVTDALRLLMQVIEDSLEADADADAETDAATAWQPATD